MSVAAYPVYKDSGVDWIGAIPSHWEAVPLLALAKEVEECNSDLANTTLLSLSYGRIILKDIDSNDGLLPESFDSYQIVRPGDIILRLTDLQNDKRSLRTALCNYLGIITSAYVAIRPAPGFSPYLSRLLHAYDLTKVFYSLGGGLRQTMKFGEVRRMPILLPPPAEQSAIAAFLDRETGKIDALVAEQERLIALLKEKRQAVISQAVTKGLDPNAPMMASGVAWLGQMPAHWSAVQLGRLCRGVSDGPHFSPNYVDEGVPFLSARNIRVDGWSLGDVKYVSEDDFSEFSKRVVPERGDVLYTKGGTTGVARAVDLDFRFQVWVHVAVLKLRKERVIPDFLAYALNSVGCYEQSQLFTRGATNQDLGLTRMTRIWLALPSIDEQSEIVSFVDQRTRDLDLLINDAARAVSLLKERRAALISAAVTGKIDVRGLVLVSQEAACAARSVAP